MSCVKIVDTHCHLDFEELRSVLAAEMLGCIALGVEGFLIPGVKREFWSRQADLALMYPSCRIAFGLHPYFIEEHQLEDVAVLQQSIENRANVSAIGEIGLDKGVDCWGKQVELFRRQVRLASHFGLPILIHSRKAHSEILHLLAVEGFRGRGVIHGFSGSFELAMSYWKRGISIGIGGVITYPSATKTRKAIARMPLSSILLETDSPSMPVFQQSGGYNVPSNIIHVLSALQRLREEPEMVVRHQIYRNSCALLGVNEW